MPRPLGRRTFLGAAVAATAGLALDRDARARSPSPGTELVVGAKQFKEVATGQLSLVLVAIDAHGKTTREIPLAFHFHGFVPNPRAPERAVLFEKQGPGSCEVDLRSGTVLRTITTTPDRKFYGHGAYAPDGSILYATETKLDGTGVITVRDGRTFAIVGDFPTFGARPHDCRLIDGGNTLVVANGGGKLDDQEPPPSVTYVDVRTQKLMERLEVPNPRINAGHLALGPHGELALVSAPRRGLPASEPGGLTIRAADRRFLTLTEPVEVTRKMVGEVLSIALHPPSGVIGVTTPDANLLTFWDMRRRRLLKKLDVEYPRGITITEDQQHFAVSCGKIPRLDYYKTSTLALIESKSAPGVGLTGSHIYTHRCALT